MANSERTLDYGDWAPPQAIFVVKTGVALLAFIATGLGVLGQFGSGFTKHEPPVYAVMIAGALILAQWGFLSMYEMNVFLKWMDSRPYEPQNTFAYLIMYLLIAVPIGTMMVFAASPRVAATAFAIYAIGDAVLAPVSVRWVRSTAENSRKRLNKLYDDRKAERKGSGDPA